jgi:hypothetical protein
MVDLKLQTSEIADILVYDVPDYLVENLENIPMPKYDEFGLLRMRKFDSFRHRSEQR